MTSFNAKKEQPLRLFFKINYLAFTSALPKSLPSRYLR